MRFMFLGVPPTKVLESGYALGPLRFRPDEKKSGPTPNVVAITIPHSEER